MRHGEPGPDGVAAVRRVVAAHLPGGRVDSVVAVGEGTDNLAYEVNGELIVRWSKEADAAARAAGVQREARLLAAVAAISPLSRPSRPTRTAQRAECSSGYGPRFLANLWQMALRAEVEDALCLVELRGFEPLTPCMPSRDCVLKRCWSRRLCLSRPKLE